MTNALGKKGFSINSNQLKMIALISMIVDHVGFYILGDIDLLRIIGRIALPIYAYTIAEGCRYTKDRKRYLGLIAAMALVFQLVFWVFMKSLYQGILVTFSLSIVIIFSIDALIKSKDIRSKILAIVGLAAAFFIGFVCPEIFGKYGFKIDYNVWGISLPILMYFTPTKKARIVILTVFLALMAIISSSIQWWALLAIPFIALYNGERGSKKYKYFFYIIYPLHLVIIYGIRIVLELLNLI